MNYDIEIQYRDYDLVEFTVKGVPYKVDITIEVIKQMELTSFNQFNDKETYSEVTYFHYNVEEDTLKKGDKLHEDKELCKELERHLN